MKADRLLEDIKSKIDIVDFISGHIQLKKTGQNWKGLCPFHSEKTPSFTVNQSKQIFHCFGCGVGGDVISFVSKYENLSFNEAVNLLAKKAGIPLTMGRIDKNALQKNEQIRNALAEAVNYFTERLRKSVPAGEYIKNRGIKKEYCELFKIGYAPSGWHNLLKHLRDSGYSDAIIKDAGLAVSGNKGPYDMFRERIIFPITSINGNVVAFGGRSLDNSTPKYINSPETVIFKKSDTLFGLYTAKEEIIRKDRVIIVEGYMDVIICYQYGFKNVVAPLGTALTSGHLHKLRTLTNKAVLVFDGDAAGVAAARRSLSVICQNAFKAKVLLLPDNEDPDSFLRKHGDPAFGELMENARSMIDFILSVSRGEQTDVVREALTMIAGVKDVLAEGEMIKELSDKTRIPEIEIRQEYKNIKNKTVLQKSGSANKGLSGRNNEEYLLLSAVIAFPEKSGYVLSMIDPGDIKDKTVASLLNRIADMGDRKDLSVILDKADDQEKIMFTKLSVDPGFDLEHVDRNIEDCLRRIEKKKLDERLRLAEGSGDLKLIHTLLLEKKKFIEGKRL